MRSQPETVTKSGIIIPEKSQTKVQEAEVVAVGGGSRNQVFSLFSEIWWKCFVNYSGIEFYA